MLVGGTTHRIYQRFADGVGIRNGYRAQAGLIPPVPYPPKGRDEQTKMNVKPIILPNFDWLKSDLVRSPGVHASDIYGDLFKKLEPKRYDYPDDGNPLLMVLGTAWERHFEYLLHVNGVEVERPGEFMSPNGIAYSPDLIIFNGKTRLGEIKYTSMSADGMPEEETNNLPAKLDKYMAQMKLYANWLGVNDGWLAILFNHQPWNPQFRLFDIHWTDQDLQDNYQMLMNHAKSMGVL